MWGNTYAVKCCPTISPHRDINRVAVSSRLLTLLVSAEQKGHQKRTTRYTTSLGAVSGRAVLLTACFLLAIEISYFSGNAESYPQTELSSRLPGVPWKLHSLR
jgi:hypothetical protein